MNIMNLNNNNNNNNNIIITKRRNVTPQTLAITPKP